MFMNSITRNAPGISSSVEGLSEVEQMPHKIISGWQAAAVSSEQPVGDAVQVATGSVDTLAAVLLDMGGARHLAALSSSQ